MAKPRAKGRNIVGQQLPTLLDVTCSVRLHSRLHVVACSWELFRGMPVALHGKNPVPLYPKLLSQPIGLRKIFIDPLFFQADQTDCSKSVSISNRFASSEER